MDLNLIAVRLGVLVKHPSLILYLSGGEIGTSQRHIAIELRRARRLYDECAGDAQDVFKLAGIFKERLCYGNSYLYAVCRRLQPSVVVETGVRRGASTAFILQALHDNGKGFLYSIDLPNVIVGRDRSSVLPPTATTGYMVPKNLAQERWKLVLGDAKVELPKLLDGLDSLDVFHHDSLHTYEHMLFEYRVVWPKLKAGGALASDDVVTNAAFGDFCREKGIVGRAFGTSGMVLKNA